MVYMAIRAEKVYRVTCLRSVPEWLTKGRTVLVVKDKGMGGEVPNFAPITCLHVPLMWKLLTGGCCWQIQYFEHLERKSLLPKEQKECRRNSQGTKDQLFIAEGAKKALEWSGGL